MNMLLKKEEQETLTMVQAMFLKLWSLDFGFFFTASNQNI